MYVDDSIRKAVQIISCFADQLHSTPVRKKSVGYIRFHATAAQKVDKLWSLSLIATVKSWCPSNLVGKQQYMFY